MRQRVDSLESCINTFLFHSGHVRFSHLAVAALLHKRRYICMALGGGFRQRMLRSHRHIAHAHQRVRAGGIHSEAVFAVLQREV